MQLDTLFCKSNAACMRRDSRCETRESGNGDLGFSREENGSRGGDGISGEVGGEVVERAVKVDMREGGERSDRRVTETKTVQVQHL